MREFIDRENQIFDVLQTFADDGVEYVVVGGYGVSAYEHRFSVDADLVIRDNALDRCAALLENEEFVKRVDADLDVYGGRFVAYERDAELPVSIDLLVNGVTSRQTDATWRYDYLRQYAGEREIQGSEQAVTALVPDPELLIAIKLHSGRLTDVRDVVALAADANLAAVEQHLVRGDEERVQAVLDDALEKLRDEDFVDAFKGVFQQQELPAETIDRVTALLEEQRNALADRGEP